MAAQTWMPGERAVEVAPRFAPVVGDPIPRRVNYVAGRTLTDAAFRTEQTHRDLRLGLLARALDPGVLDGLDVAVGVDGAGRPQIRVSPGIALTASGEEVRLTRSLTARLAAIPAADPLIHPGPPTGLVVLCLEPVRAIAANNADPADPCPLDPDAAAFADLVTLDGTRLVWTLVEDDPVVIPTDGRKGIVRLPANPALGLPQREVRQSIFRNTTAQRLIEEEAQAAARGALAPWARAGAPIALLQITPTGQVVFLDQAAVARIGGSVRRVDPSARMGVPHSLRRARFDQFVAHLQDLRAARANLAPAIRHFRYLPPIGVLPATLVDFTKMTCKFFPFNYMIQAAPVPIEQLEAVLSDRAGLDTFDLARRDYVQLIVPVPEHLYDPRLLITEVIDPLFDQAILASAQAAAAADATSQDLRDMGGLMLGLIDYAEIILRPRVGVPGRLVGPALLDAGRKILTDLSTQFATLPVTAADKASVSATVLPQLIDLGADPGGQGEAFRKTSSFQGLRPVVNRLTERVDRANDLIDLGFTRLQAEIYRARKTLLGQADASRLATSPILSQLATTGTAIEASQAVTAFFNAQSGDTPNRDKPVPRSQMVLPPSPQGQSQTPPPPRTPPRRDTQFQAMTAVFAPLMMQSTAQTPQFQVRASTALSGFAAQRADLSSLRLTTQSVALQGVLYGKSAPIRNVTIAERLRPSPAQEAKNAAVATKAEIVRSLQDLGLNLVGLSLPIGSARTTLVPVAVVDKIADGFPGNVATLLRNAKAVPRAEGFAMVNEAHLLASAQQLFPNPDNTLQQLPDAIGALYDQRAGLDTPNLSGLILAERLDPDPSDPDEAKFYAAAIDTLETTVSILRLVEGRVLALAAALDAARGALIAAYDLGQSWRGRIESAEADLAEARHDQAVAQALKAEEQARLDAINARRADILAKQVEIVAFARARTVDRFADVPGMDLYAPLPDPIPAVLERGQEPPEDLAEMVRDLAQAPVGWFPALAPMIDAIDRLRALIDAYVRARARAEEGVRFYTTAAPRSPREGGRGANGVALAMAAARNRWTELLRRRAQASLAELGGLGWRALRDRATAELSAEDMAQAGRAGAALARAAQAEFDRIGIVAAGFLEVLRTTPAELRLVWAESLSEHDDPVDLTDTDAIPEWSAIAFPIRRVLEPFHAWLVGRINRQDPEARGAMSEVIRVCLLLASHAPVGDIVEGKPTASRTLAPGETFEATITRGDVGAGMAVGFGLTLALGVVDDVIGTTALIRITAAPQGKVAVSPNLALSFTRQATARLGAR